MDLRKSHSHTALSAFMRHNAKTEGRSDVEQFRNEARYRSPSATTARSSPGASIVIMLISVRLWDPEIVIPDREPGASLGLPQRVRGVCRHSSWPPTPRANTWKCSPRSAYRPRRDDHTRLFGNWRARYLRLLSPRDIGWIGRRKRICWDYTSQ